MPRNVVESRFRETFRRAHARHAACTGDEWLMRPCRLPGGDVAPRPLVWSRRNGPWRCVPVLFVGAAPGNAGGRGSGERGAHGTRIPFGGDVAGANLDVLLTSVGLDRDTTFIIAALNHLPVRGGGEPTFAEIAAAVGEFPSSVHLLRDTILAAGPALIVALGNVALRTTVAAVALDVDSPPPARLPSIARLEAVGLRRGESAAWPDALPPAPSFDGAWRAAWPGAPLPRLLFNWHPSAQNMSPFAGVHTVFHRRMLEARDALRAACAAAGVARRASSGDDAEQCAAPGAAPATGSPSSVYELPEWRDVIGPYHARLARLWAERGIS